MVGRLTQLTHRKGTATFANYNWSFDAANRIVGFGSPDGNSSYSYDSGNQLTATDHNYQGDEAYSYDDNGNRLGVPYQVQTNNQLQSDGVYNYEYDGEGNRIKQIEIASLKVTEYVWDYRNRLTGVITKDSNGNVVKSVEYTYDVFNRRIAKEIDSDGNGPIVPLVEGLVYDGEHILLSFDGEGNQTHRYLHGPLMDAILADSRGDNQVNWALGDNQGTVRDVINSQGVLENHISYDSFGNVTGETNSSLGFRFGYTGRELDSETGLYFYRARYYDGLNGRFISEDPIGFDGGDGNLYRYVGNSPVNYVDPSGNFIPPSSGLGTVLSNLGGTLLKGLGALGGLLYTPGGGGLLNPLPTANEDEILKELQNQQNNPTTPAPTPEPAPLLPPPKRPVQPASSPNPQPVPPAQVEDPNNCKTCATDSELKKYAKCEAIAKGTGGGKGGILVGYSYESLEAAKTEFRKFRRKQGKYRWWQQNVEVEDPELPRVPVCCNYPPSQTKPPKGALHYNVTGSIFNDAGSTSVGSLGRCECCQDTNKGPKIQIKYAILNIKNFQGENLKSIDL